MRVSFGDASYGALSQQDAVVFDQLVHDLGKGLVSPKVGHHALKRARAAAMPDFGALRKRAQPFARAAVLRLGYADVAKGGVPVEFFLPSRLTPPR